MPCIITGASLTSPLELLEYYYGISSGMRKAFEGLSVDPACDFVKIASVTFDDYNDYLTYHPTTFEVEMSDVESIPLPLGLY